MGFQSQAGHVGFKTQVSKGTYASPASGGIFMRTRSGALAGTRELLIPDPEIGGGRDIADAYLGPVAFAGEYEFYPRMESLAVLLKWGLGSVSSNFSASIGTHDFTPVDTTLPWGSVEEKVGNNYDAFRYTDVKLNTLHLEAEASGYLMGTAGLIGLQQLAIGGPSATASPDFDTTPMIVGSNIDIAFNGVNLPAKSFSFDLNNNLEDDDFRLGSLFLGDATEKRREFKFGATIRPENRDLWRQAMYGSPSVNVAGGTVTKDDVTLLCETYEVISGATVYKVSFNVPLAVIAPFEVTPSGDDVIEHDIEITCLRPDPLVPILTAQVKNGLATVA